MGVSLSLWHGACYAESMTIRQQYLAVRRAYRASRKLNLLSDPNAFAMRLAAVSAMRAVVRHWDCCDPFNANRPFYSARITPRGRRVLIPMHVAAACTRFLRSH